MKKDKTPQHIKKEPVIVWVGAAKMWCKTFWVDGKQRQQWAKTKEELNHEEKI